MLKNNFVRIVLGVGLILLIPLIGTQLSDQVTWTLSDFVVAGAALLGLGFIYELGVKRFQAQQTRVVATVILLLLFLWLWAELAVGIFTTWGS